MPKLSCPAPDDFSFFRRDLTLGDPAVPAAAIVLGLNQTFEHELSDDDGKIGSVSLCASAASSVAFINDAKDPDPEELFDFSAVAEEAEEAASAPVIDPPILFDPKKAYVVLSGVTATGKIVGSVASGGLGLGLDASGALSAAYCREFPRSTTAYEALADTLTEFKSMFDPEELSALAPGETVTLGIGGKLKLALNVKASALADAISSSVQSLFSDAVAVKVTASARLALAFDVEGGYRLHAQRGNAKGSVRFIVRKTSSRILGVDGSVGVTVKLKDPNAVLKPIKAALGQITGLPATLIDQALADAPLGDLSEKHRTLVEEAVGKLKHKEPDVAAWQRLKNALTSVERKTKSILEQKAAASFSYTWRRTTEQTVVARFTLKGDAVTRHHANLLRLDIESVLADHSAAGDVTFELLLGKTVDAVEFGFGFGLGWGDFTVFKGWDVGSRRYVWQRSLDGVQVAFLGKRGYEATWLGEKCTHLVELDASTPRFAPPPPRPADFEVALQVGFSWEDRKFKDVVREVADHGLLIGALDGADVRAAVTMLEEAGLPGGRGGKAIVSILIPAPATGAVLASIAAAQSELWPLALARALPCGKFGESFGLRRNVESRMRAYAPVWQAILLEPELDLDSVGRMTAVQLDKADRNLARHEREKDTLWGWNVRGILRNNDGASAVQESVFDVQRAMSDLHRRNDSTIGIKVFEEAVRRSSPCWSHSFGARAFAAFLYLAALREPGLLKDITRKVSFTWDDGGEHALEFKQGGAA